MRALQSAVGIAVEAAGWLLMLVEAVIGLFILVMLLLYALPILEHTSIAVTIAIGVVGMALSLLLITTGTKMRRHRRHTLGTCIGCGYDLRGMENRVCPECGAEF